MSAKNPKPLALAHVGTCAILGLPNVGKSTLMNRLMGIRLMAVSDKPQTTRNRVMGAVNCETESGAGQVVFVDTPGMQQGTGPFRRFMREEALGAAGECDIALLVIDISHRKQRDMESLLQSEAASMLESLSAFSGPVILGLNKVDRIVEKSDLLPLLESFNRDGRFDALVPFSAKSGSGVDGLLQQIATRLPSGNELFPEEMYTDRAERFLAAELIREQLFRQLGDELPYASAVVIDTFQERDKGDIVISAAIHVERDSQKGIVIGKGGKRIKAVGERGRHAVSQLFGCPVHLKLFVKVNSNWSQQTKSLRELGYE
jgi:GTP-binding protein Era